MKIGLNTLLLASPFTTRSTRLFPKIKQWGYDSVEIAIEDPAQIDPAKIRRELDNNGLECGSVCGLFGPDRDLRGTPEQQQNSLKYMEGVLDQMEILGAKTLAGPVYSAVGRAQPHSAGERKQQWKTVAANLQKIADYAENKQKQICLEPLNRFETDFINTCDQAIEMIEKVNSPALRIMLDTFHMNIEEKNSAAAILKAGKLLGHVHACGCDRGTPGGDHIDWKGISQALKKIRYNGDVVVESFTPKVEVIAKAASIWRNIEPDLESIPVNGAKFLRKIFSNGRAR